MNTNHYLIVTSLLCFLMFPLDAQEKSEKCRSAVASNKKLKASLKLNERDTIEIVGKATYTITALQADDSLVGSFVFALAEAERQKIAQALNKQLNEIPSTISQQEVIAQFQEMTQCPVLKFEFPATELEIAGAKIRWQRFTLNLTEKDEVPTILLCTRAQRLAKGLDGRHNLHRFNQRLNCRLEND